jgi:hypothetical protein
VRAIAARSFVGHARHRIIGPFNCALHRRPCSSSATQRQTAMHNARSTLRMQQTRAPAPALAAQRSTRPPASSHLQL